ncbi:MAG TPA: hypothetical protein PKD54_01185 [Pirellulaceae bacterium]|nr:hypothetical protein [Pirellulaceae bacterium]
MNEDIIDMNAPRQTWISSTKIGRFTRWFHYGFSNGARNKMWFAILFVVTAVWQSSNRTAAQDVWQCVPEGVLAAVVVHRPEKIADLLLGMVDAAADDAQFVELLTGGSDPVCRPDDRESLIDRTREWIELIRSFKSICVFVTEISPSYKYCAVFEGKAAEAERDLPPSLPIAWLVDALGATHFESPEESEERQKQRFEPGSTQSDEVNRDQFLQLVKKFFTDIHVTHWRMQGKWLVLGNSEELVQNAWAACVNEELTSRSRSLVENRRFARARQLKNHRAFEDLEGYFSPLDLLPLLGKAYTPQHLEDFGFSELVGAWCEISLPDPQDKGLRGTFSFRLAVPYTVPPLGIVEVWQCSQPIQTAPDIRGLLERCDLIPRRLVIQNIDRPRRLETMERIYREKNDLAGLEAYLNEALRISGSMELDKRTFSGYTLLMQYSHRQPGHIPGSMQITKAKYADAALEMVRDIAQRRNESPGPETKRFYFGEYEGWFLDDHDHRVEAIRHGMNEQLARTSDKVANQGILAMKRWVCFVDRFVAEAFDGVEPDEIDARHVLAEYDQVLADLLHDVNPWWLEVMFPEFREIIRLGSLRFNYYCTFLDQRLARRRQISGQEITLETRSDRLYAIGEWFYRRTLNQFGPDVQAFACREGWFEWHWRARIKDHIP